MRRLSSEYMIPMVVLIIVGVVVGFLIYGGDLVGLNTDDVNMLVSVLPGIFVLLVSFYAVSKTSGYMQSGAIAGVGLAFVFLIHLMDEQSLLIPSVGISANELSLVIIIIFLIAGVAKAVGRY